MVLYVLTIKSSSWHSSRVSGLDTRGPEFESSFCNEQVL